ANSAASSTPACRGWETTCCGSPAGWERGPRTRRWSSPTPCRNATCRTNADACTETPIMSKNRRQSRDQKRKAKLSERARRQRAREPVSLAYEGNKYKTDELLPVVSETELGIHMADQVSDNRLLDRHVKQALEQMVLGLRDDSLPPFELRERIEYVPGEEADLITYMIRRNWDELFVRFPDPGKDDQIGILRTLLNS